MSSRGYRRGASNTTAVCEGLLKVKGMQRGAKTDLASPCVLQLHHYNNELIKNADSNGMNGREARPSATYACQARLAVLGQAAVDAVRRAGQASSLSIARETMRMLGDVWKAQGSKATSHEHSPATQPTASRAIRLLSSRARAKMRRPPFDFCF